MSALPISNRYARSTLTQFDRAVGSVRAHGFDAAEEALADEALLALFKLRDRLVHRNANSLACSIDKVMADLEKLARESVG